jgi:hypothetical protein
VLTSEFFGGSGGLSQIAKRIPAIVGESQHRATRKQRYRILNIMNILYTALQQKTIII